MVITTESNGFEMKAAVMLGGTHDFVALPGLSPRSAMSSARAMERAYGRYLKDTRVILMDRRKEIPPDYSIEQMAEDTAVVLKKLGVHNAAVFGLSQGGMIAQMLTIRHPELVRCLVLGSTTAKTNASLKAAVDRWTAYADAGNGDALNADIIRSICSKSIAERFAPILSMLYKGLTEAELKRFAILARTCLSFDIEPYLNQITCPALVIGSEGDTIMGPEASRQLAEKLHAELYLYGPAYGHAIYDEAQDYPERVARFVSSVFENTALL